MPWLTQQFEFTDRRGHRIEFPKNLPVKQMFRGELFATIRGQATVNKPRGQDSEMRYARVPVSYLTYTQPSSGKPFAKTKKKS